CALARPQPASRVPMSRIGRRLLASVFIVWAVVSLTFVINNVLPSDPARLIAGAHAPPQVIERLRKQLGLDQPLAVQYGSCLRRIVHTGPSPIPPTDKDHATCAAIGPVHIDPGKSYQ